MLVEGIGDEVVLLLSALLAVGLIILAWLSTHVAEQQVNVILIDRRSFHTLVQRLLNHIPGRRGDRANNNTVASDNNHADTDDLPQVPDDESVPEVPPLEELFDMDITADGGDLMPVQIVGMSEMEHFINHSESEEINISGINQAVGQETTVEAVASTSATEHVSPLVDGLSDEAENNEELHPVQTTSSEFDDSDDVSSTITDSIDDKEQLRKKHLEYFESKQDFKKVVEKNESTVDPLTTNTDVDSTHAADSLTKPCDKPKTNEAFKQAEEPVSVSEPSLTASSADIAKDVPEQDQPSVEPPSHSTTTSDDDLDSDLPEGHIRIRIKYLDERQKWVQANPQDTIGDFKRAHFADELVNQQVRFIFNGRELLRDASTLASYNIIDNDTTIHCLLSRQANNGSDNTQNQTPRAQHVGAEDVFDIGQLMMPLCGIILGLGWYFRVQYRAHFSATATIALIALTLLFVLVLLAASWHLGGHGNRRGNQPTQGLNAMGDVMNANEREDRRQGIVTRVRRLRLES